MKEVVIVSAARTAVGDFQGSLESCIIMAAINELKRRSGRYACATMCASGGPGCAFIVERMPEYN